MKKIVIPIVIVTLVVGAVVWNYYSEKRELDVPSFTGSGTIEATEINLSSQISSTVKKILVEEGQTVKAGQDLLIMDDTLLKDSLKQARAGVDSASAAVKAAEDESSSEKATAKAQLDSANATLAMAQTQLSYATVKAPIAGSVLEISQNAGENVLPGNNLIIMGDLNNLSVKVFIPENKLGKIKLNQQASAVVDSFPGDEFDGKIIKIASEAEFTPTNVETKDQRVKLVYEVTVSLQNKEGKLKPGMPADITFKF